METDFNNMHQSIINIEDFSLYWRFEGEPFPERDLRMIEPLNMQGAKLLSDFLKNADLHAEEPFKTGFFKTVDYTNITDDNAVFIKEWLYGKGISPDKKVYLIWDMETAAIVPFKVLVEYFEDFYYPSSDDLTVFDEGLNWALLFHHADILFWGEGRLSRS